MLSGNGAPIAFCYLAAAALTISLWVIATSGGVSAGGRMVAALLLKLLLFAYVLFGAAVLLFGIALVSGHFSREGAALFVGLFLVLPFGLVNFVPSVFLLAKAPNPRNALRDAPADRRQGASASSTIALGVAAFFGACTALIAVGIAAHYAHHWWVTADERALRDVPRGNRYFDAAAWDADAPYFVTRTLNPAGTVFWSADEHTPRRESSDPNAKLLRFDSPRYGAVVWSAERVQRTKLRIGSLQDNRRGIELPVGEEILEVAPIPRSDARIAVLTIESLQIWSLDDLALVRRVAHGPGGVPQGTHDAFRGRWKYHFAVAPDGSRMALALGEGSVVVIMDPDAAGEHTVQVPLAQLDPYAGRRMQGLLFAPDGARLYVAHAHGVAALDAASGAVLGNLGPDGPCTLWRTQALRLLAASADGARLLVATDRNAVCVLDTAAMRWQRQISHESYGPVPGPAWWWRVLSTEPAFVDPASPADAVAASADGSRVAISAPATNRTLVFDAATGALVREICAFHCHDEHANTLRRIALSSDGAVLLFSNHDTGDGAWDTASGRFLFALEDPARRSAMRNARK